MEREAQTEWTFSARAETEVDLIQAVKRAGGTLSIAGWETPGLQQLAGNKEACEILGVQKMTLKRWLEPDTGDFGPDKTYMIPPKRIDAGPVWVRSDVERFATEVGRQRAKPGGPQGPRRRK